MPIVRQVVAAPYRLADAFVPDGIRNKPGGEAVRARILTRSSLVAVLLLLPFLCIHGIWQGPGHILSLLVLAAMSAAGVTPALLRATGSVPAAGLFLVAAESVILAMFVVHDGGFLSPALLWVPILPLFTVFFAGRRYGIANAGALIGFLLLLYVAQVQGLLPAVYREREPVHLVAFLSTVAVLVQLVVIALLYLVWQRAVQSELRRANRAKSRFLSRMSHELRTPLNAVIGYAEVLERDFAGPLSARQREYAGNIRSAGQHLLALVEDILDLSRIEARKLALEMRPLRLKPLLESSTAMFEHELQSRRIRFRQLHNRSIDGATLLGDERRLRQVLYNLLSNAIKFTPEGGEVALESAIQGPVATIRVRDTGIGIHPAQLGKIFQSFHQAHDRQEWIRPGTGLGLALTRELVQRHGGTIRAESDGEGRGSTFTVELPLAPPGAA